MSCIPLFRIFQIWTGKDANISYVLLYIGTATINDYFLISISSKKKEVMQMYRKNFCSIQADTI